MTKAGKNRRTLTTRSDEEIVILTRTKSREYFKEIVRRYDRRMRAYVRRFVPSVEDSEDLVQEIFLKTYRTLKRFDVRKRFSPWIYRIAHNEIMNYLSRTKRKHFISWEDAHERGQEPLAESEDTLVHAWLQKELHDAMHGAMEKLPPHYREILRLRYFDDCSYETIGKKLKKPVNTVGTLLRRAKRKMLDIVMRSDDF